MGDGPETAETAAAGLGDSEASPKRGAARGALVSHPPGPADGSAHARQTFSSRAELCSGPCHMKRLENRGWGHPWDTPEADLSPTQGQAEAGVLVQPQKHTGAGRVAMAPQEEGVVLSPRARLSQRQDGGDALVPAPSAS